MPRGICGEPGVDGWVEWSTCDEGMSYEPTIACGTFLLFIGHGKCWGASSEERVVVALIRFDEDGEATEPERFEQLATEAEISRETDWSCDALIEACVYLAEIAGHPAPENVADAARLLWDALAARAIAPGMEIEA